MERVLAEVLVTISLYPFSTVFLAPRSVRYFQQWKKKQKRSLLALSVFCAVSALFLISFVFLLNLKSILQAPFP
jgi:hypothetical protein